MTEAQLSFWANTMGLQPSDGGTVAPLRREVSDSEIARAIEEILQKADGTIYMSALGLKLSQHFANPIREILGDRKLKTIIDNSLTNRVQFVGTSSKMEVRLMSDAERLRPRRYDPTFWAAFAKPIASGKVVRVLQPQPPYDFQDCDSLEARPEGWLTIAAAAIPDPDLPKDEREAAVKGAIVSWCNANSLSPRDFGLTTKARAPRGIEQRLESTERPNNISALVKFIEAIPAQERKDYSLPLNLIYQYLR